MKISWVLFTTIPLLLGLYNLADSQPVISGQDTISRTIITAFPFLGIAPDARSSGLGNTGVASIRNLAPLHWNVAGLSFLPENLGFHTAAVPG